MTTNPNSLALPNSSSFDWSTSPPNTDLSDFVLAVASNDTTSMGNVTAAPSDLEMFSTWYSPIHGVAAPIICVLGIIANCLNIVVLTRKNMVSPTNVLLAGLAISDGLTMAAYFPYAILNYHVYRRASPPFGNAQYLMFFAIFSVVVHSISIWLTVSLAVFRFIVIRYPRRGAKLCNIQRANLTIIIVCLVVTIVCIPNSVSYVFVEHPMGNGTGWFIDVRDDSPGYIFLKSFNLWVQVLPRFFSSFCFDDDDDDDEDDDGDIIMRAMITMVVVVVRG